MLGVAILCACISESNTKIPANAVRIGVLAPFSGRLASLGGDIEKAALWAAESVNATSQVPIAIITRDSASGVDGGLQGALELLYDENVVALVGPEEIDLALALRRDVAGLGRLHVMPGIASPRIRQLDSTGAWMRLAPPENYVACAFVKQLVGSGVDQANAIAANDDYHLALVSDFATMFAREQRITPSFTIDPGASSFAGVLATAASIPTKATLLLTTATTGADIVREGSALGNFNWYFGPLLADEAFVRNVPVASVAGLTGLALPEAPDAFVTAFIRRWGGSAPVRQAARYYDAVALIGLAVQAEHAAGNDAPTALQLRDYIASISAAPGIPIGWNELDRGMALARGGVDSDYHGAAGEYEIDVNGDATTNPLDVWTVHNGHIATIGTVVCTPEEAYAGQ